MANEQLSISWQDKLITDLLSMAEIAPYVSAIGGERRGIHLAVLVEPYLSFILEGKKTIESRFSVNRHAPFEQVEKGDIIVLKRSSGPVQAVCRVSNVWFYRLMPETWPDIERFAKALCMDDSPFWQEKRAASYATLMEIDGLIRLPDLNIEKIDPRGWVILRDRSKEGQGCLFP